MKHPQRDFGVFLLALPEEEHVAKRFLLFPRTEMMALSASSLGRQQELATCGWGTPLNGRGVCEWKAPADPHPYAVAKGIPPQMPSNKGISPTL